MFSASESSGLLQGKWRVTAAGLALGLLVSVPAFAMMQSLDDESLGYISGQAGLQMEINSPAGISSTEMDWMTDGPQVASPNTCNTAAPSGGTANQQACTIINNLTLSGVSPSPLYASLSLDVGANTLSGSSPNIAMTLDWDPLWITTSGISLRTATVNSTLNSLGSLGIRTDGYLTVVNRSNLFNANAGFLGQVDFTSGGDIIYRQGPAGQPELSFGNFSISNRFTNGAASGHSPGMGRIGFDDNGLLVDSSYARMSLLFDIMYKAAPAGFDTTGRSSLTLFGWEGGLVSPSFRVSGGGYAYGSSAPTAGNNVLAPATAFTYINSGTRSQGLNITTAWTFDTDFTWVIGQAAGNRTQVRFTNWQDMGTTAQPWLLMPVTIDVIQNNLPASPAMGLCFGGGFTSGVPNKAGCETDMGVTGNATGDVGTWISTGVATGKAAFGVFLRDAHLWAYNTKVEVRDPTVGPATVYDWALIYTYGKMDADIFIYPEGRGVGVTPTATANGIKADVTLMAQSPGYWERANSTDATTRAAASSGWATNTHFMLADTDTNGAVAGTPQFGVGLVNADLMWRARDLYIRVVASDGGYPDMPGGLWLQSDSGSRYFMRGLFGGGDLSNLSSPSGIALVSLDLSTNRFLFVLSPGDQSLTNVPIGFDAILDFDGNASFSMAEISQPTAAFRLSSVSGRVAWKNGTVTLVSGQNNPPTNLPYLTIANDLLFGSSADFGGGGGAPMIGTLGFGTEAYGRIILPGGSWHSELSLKIP